MSNNVLLINMPWADVTTPSLQLGLLKSVLQEKNITCDIAYLNLRFAAALGTELYEKILNGRLMSFTAEWLFNRELIMNKEHSIDDDVYTITRFRERAINFFDTLGLSGQDDPFITTFGNDFVDTLLRIRYSVIPDFLDKTLMSIDFDRYDCIGFSCTFNQTAPSLVLAKLIKERYPDKLIVMGGTSFWDEMGVGYVTAYPWLNCAALGEGEELLPVLINYYREHGTLDALEPDAIPGLCWRTKKGVIVSNSRPTPVFLDENPIPDYHDYYETVRQIREKSDQVITPHAIHYESSRGCLFREKKRCLFCGLNTGKAPHRTRSADRTAHEIKTLTEQYHNLYFKSTDMHMPKSYLKDFFPQMKALGAEFKFSYEIRVNLTKAELTEIAASGLRFMQIGIESYNTNLLTLMNKGKRALDNIRIIKWCTELGIQVIYNILWGFPGENPDDYRDMAKLMEKLVHIQPPTLPTPLQIIRHSDYYNNHKDYGITELTPFYEYELIFPGKNTSSLAFCFEYDRSGNNLPYVKELNHAILRWQKRFFGKPAASLFYKEGLGFTEVHDNRSKGINIIKLEGVSREVFTYCDTIRSFDAILAFINRQNPKRVSQHELERLLDWFCETGLFVSENRDYLGLAIRRNGLAEKVHSIYGKI